MVGRRLAFLNKLKNLIARKNSSIERLKQDLKNLMIFWSGIMFRAYKNWSNL